jgi:polyisoprenoid-binding protein YceI
MFLILAAVLITSGPALAEPGGSMLKVVKGSRLWLEGDSTLHRYKADATQFRADFKVAEGSAVSDLEALVRTGGVKGLVLEVPVSQLRSGKSDLDENMVKALNGRTHPSISFRMDSYQVLPATGADAAFMLKLRGRLSISGVEKPVDLDASVVRTATGLQLIGSKQLLMSDYSVTPPELMMGMLKTRNEIIVKFDLLLQAE